MSNWLEFTIFPIVKKIEKSKLGIWGILYYLIFPIGALLLIIGLVSLIDFNEYWKIMILGEEIVFWEIGIMLLGILLVSLAIWFLNKYWDTKPIKLNIFQRKILFERLIIDLGLDLPRVYKGIKKDIEIYEKKSNIQTINGKKIIVGGMNLIFIVPMTLFVTALLSKISEKDLSNSLRSFGQILSTLFILFVIFMLLYIYFINSPARFNIFDWRRYKSDKVKDFFNELNYPKGDPLTSEEELELEKWKLDNDWLKLTKKVEKIVWNH